MIHDYLENPRLRTVVQDKPHPGANANYNSLDSRVHAHARRVALVDGDQAEK